jgi:hypothetical protein
MVEATTIVAQVLNRFDVTVLPCDKVRPVAVATLRPSRPVRVVLRARSAR